MSEKKELDYSDSLRHGDMTYSEYLKREEEVLGEYYREMLKLLYFGHLNHQPNK